VLQDIQDPRSKCKIYDTGNIHDSVIPALYQSTVTCIHKVRLYYSTTYNAIPKVSTRAGRRTMYWNHAGKARKYRYWYCLLSTASGNRERVQVPKAESEARAAETESEARAPETESEA
jgi:hypothetical protein